MKIKACAEKLHAHRAALDVPTRPALSPWTGPINFAVFGNAGLPQRKVGDRLLAVLVTAHTLASAHLLEIQIEQLPVATTRLAIIPDAEIHGAILCPVSNAAL